MQYNFIIEMENDGSYFLVILHCLVKLEQGTKHEILSLLYCTT